MRLLLLNRYLLLVLAFLLSTTKKSLASREKCTTQSDLRGVLVLLVLCNKILHVGFRLRELHFVHTLLGVPMQESLPLEHGRELVADAAEKFLNGSRVTEERHGHLQATGRDVTLGGEHVVGDPLDEVCRVLVLNILHLLLNLLHRDLATEDSSNREVTAVPGVGSGHHVLGIEHLLGKLRNGNGAVLLATTSGQGGKASEEEVKTRERN